MHQNSDLFREWERSALRIGKRAAGKAGKQATGGSGGRASVGGWYRREAAGVVSSPRIVSPDHAMTSATPAALSSELLRREDEAGVVTLTLTTPQNRNALSLAMIDTLIVAFADIAKDEKARVVVLAGEGPALSAGHDLREIQAHRNDPDRGWAFNEQLMARCASLMQAIVALPKPVIAAVEGVATAAGCQLVAACDLAIAGKDARFALPGVNTGLFCSSPLVAVGRAVSRKHAMEMALTGKFYSAAEAERFGLVNRVVPPAQALAEAQALARTIAERSGPTIAIGKRAFYEQIEQPLDLAYALAAKAMVENLAEPDSVEGIAAFLEKRQPRWGA
jgi:enoyl-CoA hydratase/carnithine racemase